MIMERRSGPTHVPGRALTAVLRASSLLVWLSALSGCAEGEVESTRQELAAGEAELTGELKTYIVDHADGSYREGHVLELASGEQVELSLAKGLALTAGREVSLAGAFAPVEAPLSLRDSQGQSARKFVATRVLAERATDLGASQQALVNPPPSTHTAAVVLMNFAGIPAQNYSVEDARRELDAVEGYYDELSYGAFTLDIDVFGPYEIPPPDQCELGPMVALGKQVARDHGVNIDAYEHVGVKIPNLPGFSCPCGVAWLGETPAQGGPRNGGESLYTCGGSNAYAHEMGHGFGLHHASTGHCAGEHYRPGLSGCNVDEYGNRYNTMGNGLGHMTAFQKATMGWTAACNNLTVRADGVFDLAPIQVPSDAPQALQIDTGDTRDGKPLFFFVEYRNPDAAMFNAVDDGSSKRRELGPGLHISVSRDFHQREGEGRPILLDLSPELLGFGGNSDPRLQQGESFTSANVTVELVDLSPERARVKVTFPGGGSGQNQCQNGQTPPPLSDEPPSEDPPFPSGPPASLYEHCNYGGWAVALEEGEYTTADLIAVGAFDNGVSSLEVAEGYEVTVFDEDNFAGESLTFTAALACLVEPNFNDRVSSLRVRSLVSDDDAGSEEPPTGDGDGDTGDGDTGDGDSGDGDGDTGDGDTSGDGDDDNGDGDSGDGDAMGDDDGAKDEGDDTDVPPASGVACSLASTSRSASAPLVCFAALAVSLLRSRRRASRRA